MIFPIRIREGIESWETAMSREALWYWMPLYRFALFGAGENTGGIFLKIHHIISDGWSQMLGVQPDRGDLPEAACGERPEPYQILDYELHVREGRGITFRAELTKEIWNIGRNKWKRPGNLPLSKSVKAPRSALRGAE